MRALNGSLRPRRPYLALYFGHEKEGLKLHKPSILIPGKYSKPEAGTDKGPEEHSPLVDPKNQRRGTLPEIIPALIPL